LPYNINVLSQTAVQFALEHASTLEEQSGMIRQERMRLTTLLTERGYTVWGSEANFVVMECGDQSARALFEGLKQHRILVKCLDGSHPRLANTLRLTVGAPEESNALLAALDQLVSG
jgi:histidinol-phosphate aminotransferase